MRFGRFNFAHLYCLFFNPKVNTPGHLQYINDKVLFNETEHISITLTVENIVCFKRCSDPTTNFTISFRIS